MAESVSEFFFKSVNIWQSYKQERGCLMHFVRLTNTLLKTGKSAIISICDIQYNTIQYKICKAPCCRGFRGAGEQVS